VASVEEIIAACEKALVELATALTATQQAQQLWEESVQALQHAAQGSNQPEITAHLPQLIKDFADALPQLQSVITSWSADVARYRDSIKGTAPTAAPAPPAAAAATSPAASRAQTDVEARTDRAKQRVGTNPVGSSPAHGEWVCSDGSNVRVLSGKTDNFYPAARAFALQLPPDKRAAINLAHHIEVKVAVQMHQTNSLEETVVVDRSVCGTRSFDSDKDWTCHRRLEDTFVPPGGKLHVVDPVHGKVTYTGRMVDDG
jgi:hypothetical protein